MPSPKEVYKHGGAHADLPGTVPHTPDLPALYRFRLIKRSHFAGGVLTPPLTKGDARPLWKPHNFVPASRGGVNIEFTNVGCSVAPELFGASAEQKFDKGAPPGYLRPMKSIQFTSACWVGRRWVNVVLLITVFFLPLHFHLATASVAQINKECACVQGSRAQLGQIAPSVASVALVSSAAILTVFQEECISHFASTQHSRAPPVL